jgi:hypothetical protein
MVRMMRRVVLVFVILLAMVIPSRADYLDYYFKLSCEQTKNRAEIIPYFISNARRYIDVPQDCTLANGRTIRAKMGLGPTYPYGEGYGDPSMWLSVWVDKALVLSRTHFSCSFLNKDRCDIQINVNTKGLEVCRPEQSEELSQPYSSKKLKDHCEFTPNEKLSKTRDALEFPSPGERVRPSAGSLVTLFAKDKQFCSQFQQLAEPLGGPKDNIWPCIGLPKGFEAIEADSSSPYEYEGGYKQYTFDINNDGTAETVVGLHTETHYRDGDIYFVYSVRKVPKPIVEKMAETDSELTYAKAATRIIPHYWSDNAGADEKKFVDSGDDNGAYEVKSLTTPWWDNKDSPSFSFRYWHLEPFRFKQTIFFLTRSQEAYKQHWYIVLRPEPNYQVTEMCVFQIVQVRY